MSPTNAGNIHECHDVVRQYHVPPSVQEVFCTLYKHDPMTGQELRQTTGLPRRTVYEALRRLKQLGLLRERVSLKDTRQSYFWIPGTSPRMETPPGATPA